MTLLVLGSASPRRARLLSQLGVPFEVRSSDVAEDLIPGESARDHATRLARDKALAVSASEADAFVLGSDTVVSVDEEILGKPVDAADARRMLLRLSGKTHRVLTAVALVGPGGAVRREVCEESLVRFRKLAAAEIDRYVAGGEPLDKAGAYAIQGGAADFVARLQGSYENVVGLPLDEVRVLLEQEGLYPPRLGR